MVMVVKSNWNNDTYFSPCQYRVDTNILSYNNIVIGINMVHLDWYYKMVMSYQHFSNTLFGGRMVTTDGTLFSGFIVTHIIWLMVD